MNPTQHTASSALVRGKHYLTGLPVDLRLGDGRIAGIQSAGSREPDLGGKDDWISPGLVDLQVNGYRGRDFTSGDITPAGVMEAAERIAEAGVTSFCPTVTTHSSHAIEASLAAIARACEMDPDTRDRILGIHLEGPYITPEDGARGAHPREHVRPPDWDEFSRFQEVAGGRIRIVTLAPDQPGALDFISRAARTGVVVALGHHGATREQIHAAVDAGAVLSTHLGNGSHGILPRHPNYIWEQLAHDGLQASIIVDGHHLPPSVVKTFFRAKGCERLILVSDVIAAAGLGLGRHYLMGLAVEIREDQSVRIPGTPYLGGSILKLSDAVRHMMDWAGASFAEAIQMGSSNPLRLLRADAERGRLAQGLHADLAVWREAAGGLKLAATLSGGKLTYTAPAG